MLLLNRLWLWDSSSSSSSCIKSLPFFSSLTVCVDSEVKRSSSMCRSFTVWTAFLTEVTVADCCTTDAFARGVVPFVAIMMKSKINWLQSAQQQQQVWRTSWTGVYFVTLMMVPFAFFVVIESKKGDQKRFSTVVSQKRTTLSRSIIDSRF